MTDSSAVPATTDRIAELLAEHEYTATFLGAAGACSCGREWPSNRTAHRAHVASLLAVLVADAQTDAWDEGWEEHGFEGNCTCIDCYFGDETAKTCLNPYRKVSE